MAIQPTLAQQKIYDFIEHGQGNGIIDAVAGAGKTTTLMACMAHTPDNNDVIFCAFNKSIRDEIHKKLHKNKKDVRVNTIHSLGFQMLRAHDKYTLDDHKYEKLVKDPDFFDSIESELNKILYFHQYPTIQEIRDYHPSDSGPAKEFIEGQRLVSLIVTRLLDINQKYRCSLSGNSLDQYNELVNHFGIFAIPSEKHRGNYPLSLWELLSPDEFPCYVKAHQTMLAKGNKLAMTKGIIDFTDQLYLPYFYNLTSNYKYGFVFVDECQDLSPAQLYVVKQYLRNNGRILAVGDPFQAIYGFAGADCASFQRIKTAFDCTLLGLTDCFRCPQDVIKLAQTIRPDIKGFKSEQGAVYTIHESKVDELIGKGDLVICRFRAPLLGLAMDLINRELKVKIHPDELDLFIGDYKKNFTPKELREVLTEDSVDDFFERVKQKNEKRIKSENKNADKLLREQIITEECTLLEETLEFLKSKFFVWQLNTVESILKRLKVMLSDPSEEAIKISTIHRAKGLENNRVFILKYDKLPFLSKCTQDWQITQEHNLHYVAVTRAKQVLFLSVESIKPEGSAIVTDVTAINEDAGQDEDILLSEMNQDENCKIEISPIVTPPIVPSLGRAMDFRPMQRLSKISDRFYAFDVYEDTPYSALNRTTFQKAKYWSINDHLQDSEFSICNVVCYQYMDVYFINTPNDTEIYKGTYKQTGQYNFVPQGTCINADQLMCYLTDESNYKIKFDYQPQNQGFDAVHGLITATCNDLGICITNIYEESYALVYCLKTPCSYGYIKLSHNANRIITTITPFSSSGTEDEAINALLESLKHLWQR